MTGNIYKRGVCKVAVTIRDIARASGVSRTTVSRVLNNSGYVKEETREKVESAISELNYTPNAIARSLSTSKTNTIGVVIPEINNPFFGQIVKGISQEADKAGLNIILFNTDNKETKELKSLQLLKEQRIQGILITPSYTDKEVSRKFLKTVDKSGIPVVILDGFVKYDEFNGVFIDHENGAFNATRSLIENGHKKIAIINGKMNTRPARERYDGYLKALKKFNIEYKEEYDFSGEYSWEQAYEKTKEILTMDDPPTAVFVTSNMMMLGSMKAINELGKKTPDDIAVIGFDNVDSLNIIGMNISYVYGPSFEMGIKGMKILNQILFERQHSIQRMNNEVLMPQVKLKGSEKLIQE